VYNRVNHQKTPYTAAAPSLKRETGLAGEKKRCVMALVLVLVVTLVGMMFLAMSLTGLHS